MTRTFPKEFLIGELGLPSKAVHKEFVDHTRWSVHYKIVFAHDGKFYQAYYSVGATECQYESPWEYDDTVECEEVELVEVKRLVWVPKE